MAIDAALVFSCRHLRTTNLCSPRDLVNELLAYDGAMHRPVTRPESHRGPPRGSSAYRPVAGVTRVVGYDAPAMNAVTM